MSAPLRETDLYEPVRAYLETQGYCVRAEVNGCDIAAEKDGELVVVEMKLRFTLALLMQATLRHAVTESVYLAIPAAEAHKSKQHWNGIKRLVRRLQFGLILVRPGARARAVEVALHPGPFTRRTNTRQRRAVLREIEGRLTDGNTGGSHRRTLLTAYRQRALHVAAVLAEIGAASPRQIRDHGGPADTGRICYRDVYGWFDHPEKGVYNLSDAGRVALDAYPEVVAALRAHPATPRES